MQVHFELYASLMAHLPQPSTRHRATVEVPDGATPNQLLATYGVPEEQVHLVVRNGIFVPLEERDEPLSAGDVLAVWPPVAGG